MIIQITLNSPITFTPPSFVRKTGEVRSFKPITVNEFSAEIIHRDKTQQCLAKMPFCPVALILWSDDNYESSKNLTQDQYKERILELLGNNPSSVLESLFPTAK